MRALIPVFAILGVAASAQLTFLPYVYLTEPLPVYQQSQDTRAGVHAYSYAGGPSAKEEVRGHDGVTRGSYSYVDAHDVLQSVFYVADENGFRVAATNLPTDGDLPRETGELLLARNAHLKEHSAATQRRRAARETRDADQDDRSEEKPASRQDEGADKAAAAAAARSSHEASRPDKKSDDTETARSAAAGTIVAPVYGLLDPVPIPKLADLAASHRDDARPKAILPAALLYETVLLPGQIALATSQQHRLQVHNSPLRVQQPARPVGEPQDVIKYQPDSLPLLTALPDYHENRIRLHQRLGLEGPQRKDTVKIDTEKIAIVQQQQQPFAAPIRRDSAPASEPSVYLAASYVPPIAVWPYLAPVARSSQHRLQIHSQEKIEATE